MEYTKNQINKAGAILKEKEINSKEDIIWAEDALTFWRTKHSAIITDFHNDLKFITTKVNANAIIVQRIKRSHSIISKLNRMAGMQLSRMQDIAGMRVILDNIEEVYSLAQMLESNTFPHELKNCKDYIELPKESGYRGIHVIYKYSNPKSDGHGLYIEIQLRTRLQHIWATAVETMSTFLGTHLKFNEGQQKWLKYFALTSSAFSYIEKTSPVPKYEKLSEKETLQHALYEYNYNKIKDSLSAYTLAAKAICDKSDENKKYHIVTLDTEVRKVLINSYSEDEIDIANKKYTEIERESTMEGTKQSVLVSTESIHELQDGFPNYFLDIRAFLVQMEEIKKGLHDKNSR